MIDSIKINFLFVLWAIIFCALISTIITNGLLKFPNDWDSLAYHIPLINQWFQNNSLFATNLNRWYNPGNNELLGAWFVSLFSSDFYIAINNFFPFVILLSSTILILKKLGLSSFFSNIGSIAVLSNITILRQLTNQENDMSVTAFFFSGFYYVMKIKKTKKRSDFFLFWVSCWLLIGVKYYSLGYFFILICLFLVDIKPQWSFFISPCLALFFFAIPCFWFLRNTITTGSPLFPRDFFTGHDLLLLIYPDIKHTSFLGNGDIRLFNLFAIAVYKMLGITGVIGLLWFPIGFLLGFTIAITKRAKKNKSLCFSNRISFYLLTFFSFAILMVTPFSVEDLPGTLNQMYWYNCPVRYGFCFLTLTSVSLILSISDVIRLTFNYGWIKDKTYKRLIKKIVFFLLGFLQVGFVVIESHFFGRNELALLIILTLIIFKIVFLLKCKNSKYYIPPIFFLILLGTFFLTFELSRTWKSEFVKFYGQFAMPDIFPYLKDHKNICILDDQCYPFYGPNREFHIFQPVFIENSDWLANYLKKNNITFIFAKNDNLCLGSLEYCKFEDFKIKHKKNLMLIFDFNGRSFYKYTIDKADLKPMKDNRTY